MEEDSNQAVDYELDWRQYSLMVELAKFYFNLVLQVNIFLYGITGAILAYYFAHASDRLIKYSLLLPIVMSFVLGAVFIVGAKQAKHLENALLQLASKLGLTASPDVSLLSITLCLLGLVLVGVSIALTLLVYLR